MVTHRQKKDQRRSLKVKVEKDITATHIPHSGVFVSMIHDSVLLLKSTLPVLLSIKVDRADLNV